MRVRISRVAGAGGIVVMTGRRLIDGADRGEIVQVPWEARYYRDFIDDHPGLTLPFDADYDNANDPPLFIPARPATKRGAVA